MITWCHCCGNVVSMFLLCCTLWQAMLHTMWLAMSVHYRTHKASHCCINIAGRHCRDAIWVTRCNVAAVLHRYIHWQYCNTAATMLVSSRDVTVAAMLFQCCGNVVSMLLLCCTLWQAMLHTTWLAMSVHYCTHKALQCCTNIAGRHSWGAIWLICCNVAAVLHRNFHWQHSNMVHQCCNPPMTSM